jgi:hypothetical protein
MNEFITNNIITIWVVVFVFEILMGMLAQTIAEKKGHAKRWFWAGFFLSLIGVVWAAGLPDEALRQQLMHLHETHQGTVPECNTQTGTQVFAEADKDDTELLAVLSAAVAAMGEDEGRRFVLRSFRPAGEGMTTWAKAGRNRLHGTHR